MTASYSPAQKLYTLCFVVALSAVTIMAVDLPRFYAYGPGLIGVVFLSLYYPVFKTRPTLSRPALFIAGAILGFGLLSTAHALDSGEVFDRTLKLAGVLIPGALLLSLVQNPEIRTSRLPRLWIVPIALIITALLVALELKAGAPVYRALRGMPADEFIANSVFNRGAVAAVLCVFPAFAILKKCRPTWQAALLLGAPFLLMLACVESQSAQVSAVIGLLTFLFFPYRCRVSWIALFVVIAASIMLAPFVMPWVFTHFAETLNTAPVIGQGNGFAGARLEVWDYVSRYIQTDPLYGFGIEATRSITNFDSGEIYQKGTTILHPHNFALQLWIEFGVVGAAAGALFCGYILRSIYRLGPCGARIALPVFLIALSVGATGYGLWQGWWLGALFMAAALVMIAVPAEQETLPAHQASSDCCWKMLWLWLPLASFVILAVMSVTLPPDYYMYIVEENGLLEILHFLVSGIAALIGVCLLFKLDFRTQKLLALWVLLGTLGCIYISGEEISWGQQFFRWTTPDFWLHINDQQETNLHNTSSWLDQKPRLLLEIGVIVGGILLPLLARFAPRRIPTLLNVIAPPRELAVTAVLFVVYKICDKLGDILGFVPFGRTSEITELYVYWFILAYLYWLKKKYAQ